MNEEYYAIIDASKLFEIRGVSGYRVTEIVDTEKDSLKIMHAMMNPKSRHLFSHRPKIHRSVVGREEMESHMLLMEVIAIPTSTNPDNPAYEFVIV